MTNLTNSLIIRKMDYPIDQTSVVSRLHNRL